jgi:hypothetical protein
MNGYVKNKSFTWTHAMKRAIGPGEKIPLKDLYEQYGVKHNLAEGEEFINWLRNIKLGNKDTWEIKFEGLGEIKALEEVKDQEKPKAKEKVDIYEGEDVVGLIKNMTVRDLSNLSVRSAREVLPKIMDLNLLKYSLQEVNQLTGKDTICRMLRKRIQELQIAR